MAQNLDSIMDEIAKISKELGPISSADVPNIDLYMDQVTTILDEMLGPITRKPDEDKIITKTMINNYAKNGVLIPPVKKRYSVEHVLMLIAIFYCKSFLSISDMDTLFEPLKRACFTGEVRAGKVIRKSSKQEKQPGSEDGSEACPALDFKMVFDDIAARVDEQMRSSLEDMKKLTVSSAGTFSDSDEEYRGMLQHIDYCCRLGSEIYVRQLLLEREIDKMK